MFHETWERMKDLLRKCPHHQVPRWQLVQYFYDGLTEKNRQMVDAACGGTFMLKSEDEAWALFETLSENSMHHASASRSERATPVQDGAKKAGIFEIGMHLELQNKVDQLSQKLDQLLSGPSPVLQVCALCASPAHHVVDCPVAPQYPEFVQEQAQMAQSFARPAPNPYSSTYNPGWRNHPNFSWRNPQAQPPNPSQSQPRQGGYAPGFQRTSYPSAQPTYSQPQSQEPSSSQSFEDKMLQAFSDIKANLSSHTHSIAKLETQMGQLAEALSRRSEGALPSQPVVNPRGKEPMHGLHMTDAHQEQAQAVITLRNGKQYQAREAAEERERTSEKQPVPTVPPQESERALPSEPSKSYTPKAPFPEALERPKSLGKHGVNMQEMLEIFKHVQINLPLLDAIQQVPAYAKFLKELCTQKRKLRSKCRRRYT